MGNQSLQSQTISPTSPEYLQSPHLPEFSYGVQDMIKIKKRSFTSDYILRGRLGSGSFGEVYQAIHINTGAVRATKRILSPRIHNEFCILKQLVIVVLHRTIPIF